MLSTQPMKSSPNGIVEPFALKQSEHGRALSEEPKNRTISTIALLLHEANPVRAVLEPGDGTRYDLLLVPMWNPTAALWHGRDVKDFILVVNSVANHAGSLSRRGDVHHGSLQHAARADDWTARVLHWFMTHVWARLEAVRRSDPRAIDDFVAQVMRQRT